MQIRPLAAPRFVRRTQLGPNEYRKNFHQVDKEVIAAVTSAEADRVTPLMSKIYLRLVNAPDGYWERDGVLRFEAELRGDGHLKAWNLLCEVAGVASATASKALQWMHEQGIIGYFAGKNGVGIRIFLNRASASIGVRTAPGVKKILEFSRASAVETRASAVEAAFMDSYAVSESLDTDIYPRAPIGGAGELEVYKKSSDPNAARTPPRAEERPAVETSRDKLPVGEIVQQLRRELEPSLRAAAAQAAAHEHERTREWLESKGLPKAARVAQRETYDVLRRHGPAGAGVRSAHGGQSLGRRECAPAEARSLTPDEVREMAETCVAMLEVHGQPIGVTLSGLSAEAGGTLLAGDVPKVRELAESMAEGRGAGQ